MSVQTCLLVSATAIIVRIIQAVHQKMKRLTAVHHVMTANAVLM